MSGVKKLKVSSGQGDGLVSVMGGVKEVEAMF